MHMDANLWLKLITETGVPLSILAVVGWCVIKYLKDYIACQQKKEEQHISFLVECVQRSEKRQEELVSIGRELSETNRVLSERFTVELSEINNKISAVNGKIDVLTVKVDKQD